MKTDSFIEEKIRAARQGIMSGFVWTDTPQGTDYWEEVSKNLDKLEEAAKNKSKCKEDISELKRRLAELEARCR